MTMPAELPAFRAIHERMRTLLRLRIIIPPFPHTGLRAPAHLTAKFLSRQRNQNRGHAAEKPPDTPPEWNRGCRINRFHPRR
jgi:hypothetical protein